MAKSGRVAVAELVSRGREQLVLNRPYRKGLVLHTMYYGTEVRDFQTGTQRREREDFGNRIRARR